MGHIDQVTKKCSNYGLIDPALACRIHTPWSGELANDYFKFIMNVMKVANCDWDWIPTFASIDGRRRPTAVIAFRNAADLTWFVVATGVQVL